MRPHVMLLAAFLLGAGAAPVALTSDAAAAQPIPVGGVTWSPPVMADPSTGNPTAVSCPTSSWCLAVDQSGNVFVHSQGAWSKPDRVDRQARFFSVSCPSTSFCAVVGFELLPGQRYRPVALTYTDGVWSRPATLDISMSRVSCLSATFCVAVGDAASELYDGQTWEPAGPVGGTYNEPLSVSCTSTTFCLAALRRGDVSVFNGTTWLPHTPVSPDIRFWSVSCATSSFCVVVGRYDAVMFEDGVLSAPVELGTVHVLSSVSCVDPSFCMAVARGAAVRWDGTAWQSPARTAGGAHGLPRVSCPSVQSCLFVDGQGYSLGYDGTKWSQLSLFDPIAGHLHSVSCPTTTFCAAVDYEGSALTFDGSSWTRPELIDTAHLFGVSCASPTWCVAIDIQGSASTFDGSGWSTPTRITGSHDGYLMGIDCPSATFCVAMTEGGAVVTYDGSQWSSQQLIGNGEFAALSCASPSFCLVTENDAEQVAWDGHGWGTEDPTGGYRVESMSCLSPTFCAGTSFVGNGIDAVLYNGTSWGNAQQLSDYNAFDSLSCMSTTSCEALEGSSIDYSFDGTSWSVGPRMDPHGGGMADVSCAKATTFCAALDVTGRTIITTNAQ